MTDETGCTFYQKMTQPLVEEGIVERGTIMGFPCLRLNGVFVASEDHRTGDLIVKLPKERVNELVEQGTGMPFAPAGRTFREWIVITNRNIHHWQSFLDEALKYVSQSST